MSEVQGVGSREQGLRGTVHLARPHAGPPSDARGAIAGRAHVALSPPRWGGRPRLLSAELPRRHARGRTARDTGRCARRKIAREVISRGAPGLRA